MESLLLFIVFDLTVNNTHITLAPLWFCLALSEVLEYVDLIAFDRTMKVSSSSRLRRIVPCLYTGLPSYADIEDYRLAFTSSSSTAVNLFVLLSEGTSQSLAIHNLDLFAVVRPSLRCTSLYALSSSMSRYKDRR